MAKVQRKKAADKPAKISKEKKLERLKKQQEILKARIQKMEAAEKVKERKREMRRVFLVGQYYIEQARKEGSWNKLCKIMWEHLDRDNDKALFEESEG